MTAKRTRATSRRDAPDTNDLQPDDDESGVANDPGYGGNAAGRTAPRPVSSDPNDRDDVPVSPMVATNPTMRDIRLGMEARGEIPPTNAAIDPAFQTRMDSHIDEYTRAPASGAPAGTVDDRKGNRILSGPNAPMTRDDALVARAAAMPDPYVDLPYRRSHRQLVDDTANVVRHQAAGKTVALTSAGLRQDDIDARHARALELYESARNDLRDLKLAEHETVRRRDEAIAQCCERWIGTDDTSRDIVQKTGAHPKHTRTSAEAKAYAEDPDVKDLQRQRDELTLAILYADAAVDIAARALNATHAMLLREDATIVATAVGMFARTLTKLSEEKA